MSKRRFTHNFASGVEEEDTKLNVFYCLHCGSFSLILDSPLSSFPRRRTDGSYVLEESKILRKNMLAGDVKVVKRVNGLERQYRLECPECNLFIAYTPQDHNAEGKIIYILPEALGTRQELAGAIKHHSIEELKGQLSSLLAKFPNGVLLSILRNVFRDHFMHDLDEREYGDYSSIEDLIAKALSDVARLDTLPQAGSDLLILPVSNTSTSPEQQSPHQPTPEPNHTVSTGATKMPSSSSSSETDDSQSLQSLEASESILEEYHEPIHPKRETDPSAPKPKPTDLIFQEKPKPTRPTVAIKVTPKVKQNQPQKPQPMFTLVSSDYD